MKPTIRTLVACGVGMLLGLSMGCGLEEFPLEPGYASDGPVCYTDADCVPNDCCGEGWAAVHASEAPWCGSAQCDGSCPEEMAECGCAIPVCRNSRCQLAYTDCG